MNKAQADKFAASLKRDLHDITMQQRRLGHTEFRIAAMRMFEKMDLPAQAVAIAVMQVDKYLTPEELTDREKLP